MKICIVLANYYPKISKDLLAGASKVLKNNGIKKFKTIIVPGVFEVPVVISRNINSFDGFLALGCVIKGKTAHFDLISKTTTNAIMNLSTDHKKPIGHGIIACQNKKQAEERSDPKIKNKGGETARAVLSVLGIKFKWKEF